MEIKTNKVLVRNLRITDSQDYLKNIGSNEVVGRYMLYKYIYTIEEANNVLNFFITEDIFGDRHNKGIIYNDELIGTIGYIINSKHNTCELTYNLSDRFFNQGIMTEVVNSVSKYLMNELNIDTIIVEVMKINEASNRLLEKCGFIKDGCIRGKYLDRFSNRQDINIFTKTKKQD